MDTLEKLKRLIPHWIEHNEKHTQSYLEWAQNVKDLKPELSQILSEISHESKRLNELLSKAMELINKE